MTCKGLFCKDELILLNYVNHLKMEYEVLVSILEYIYANVFHKLFFAHRYDGNPILIQWIIELKFFCLFSNCKHHFAQ